MKSPCKQVTFYQLLQAGKVTLKMRFKLVLIQFLIIYCCFGHQNTSFSTIPYLNHFTPSILKKDSPTETYDIIKSKKGVLWISTDEGVFAISKTKLTKFTTKNGLLTNIIFKCYEDYLGNIWFIGNTNELCYFDNKKEQIIPYKYNYKLKKTPFSYLAEKQILFDKNQTLLFSIKGNYACKINRYGQLTPINTHYNVLIQRSNFIVSNFTKRNSEVYWKGKEINLKSNFSKNPTLFSNNDFGDFLLMNNCIWNLKLQTKIFSSNFRILTFQVDESFLWVGTEVGGLFQIDLRTNKIISKSLNGYSISGILVDNQQLFLTSLESGVFQISNKNAFNYRFESNPISITKLTKNENSIVINTKSLGLQIIFNLPESNYSIDPYIKKHFPNKKIKYYYLANKSFLCSDSTYINGVAKSKYYVRNISPVGNKLLLMGNTLLMLDNDTIQEYLVNKKKLNGKFTDAIEFNKRVLIGSKDGLFIEKKNGIVKFPFLIENNIIDLESFNEKLYVITDSKLLIIDKKWSVKTIPIPNGKNTLLRQKYGYLFIGSTKGLYVYKPKVNSLIFLGKYNGLKESRIIDILEFKDQICIAFDHSITIIHKSHLDFNPSMFEINFKNKQKTLSYSALNNSLILNQPVFCTVTKNPLGYVPEIYMKTNDDQNWELLNSKTLNIKYLAPGNHSLQFGAFNPYLNRFQLLKTISISKPQPFYFQIWFISIVIILTGFTFYLMGRIGRELVQRKNKFLIAEQKGYQALMNPHFIFNSLHHIHYFLVSENLNDAKNYLLKFSTFLRNGLNNFYADEVELKTEIEFIKNYIELANCKFDDEILFFVKIDHSIDPDSYKIPPMMIQPIIENAIIHAFPNNQKEKLISIFIEINENNLKIIIKDNGKGFKNDLVSFGIGLTTLNNRLKILSKENSLEIRSSNSGTIATINLHKKSKKRCSYYC